MNTSSNDHVADQATKIDRASIDIFSPAIAMRVLLFLAVLVISLVGAKAANDWSHTDVEMFEIQAALEKAEGEGVNFYSFLGLTPSASMSDIRKAYRQRSLEWHPDKNPNAPEVHQRFERLGRIHSILRDERRDRYNHFLSFGFPKWRGTGYYYSRYRPGLPLILCLLLFSSMGVQLAVKKSQWRKSQRRYENLCRSALAAAWGPAFQTPLTPSSKPRPSEKKVRVPMYGYFDMPLAPKEAEIVAGTVNWDKEADKVREALHAPLPVTDDEVQFIELVVFGDGSLALHDAATRELMPLEPVLDSDMPTLMSTWPVQLCKKLAGTHKAAPEAVPEPVAEPTTSTSAISKKEAKRRKRAGKT